MPPHRPPRLERKASLYEDATLLPDRASARLREEAALAGELEALCSLLPGSAGARVSVRLGREPSVVVVLAREAGAGVASESMIRELVRGVVPGARMTIILPEASLNRSVASPGEPRGHDGGHDDREARGVETAPVKTTSPSQRRAAIDATLWLALGLTLGALIERVRTRAVVERRLRA